MCLYWNFFENKMSKRNGYGLANGFQITQNVLKTAAVDEVDGCILIVSTLLTFQV